MTLLCRGLPLGSDHRNDSHDHGLHKTPLRVDIRYARRKPDPRSRAQFDHRLRLSRMVRSNARSAPRSTLIVARPGNSM